MIELQRIYMTIISSIPPNFFNPKPSTTFTQLKDIIKYETTLTIGPAMNPNYGL